MVHPLLKHVLWNAPGVGMKGRLGDAGCLHKMKNPQIWQVSTPERSVRLHQEEIWGLRPVQGQSRRCQGLGAKRSTFCAATH
ncbi:hypothetical protein WJX74_000909 [Apatococcus lobatus]|uniref:Uncharacterized protein n=1 Tax=Apatococcus lobatus TaxID=904363 RepID=A0AAW1RL74_9CHLO